MSSQSKAQQQPTTSVSANVSGAPHLPLASHGITEAHSRTGVESYPPGTQSFLGPSLQRVKDVATTVKHAVTSAVASSPAAAADMKIPKVMKAVVFGGPGNVKVSSSVASPTLGNPETGRLEHAVILKVIATALCGSDCHMYRGSASTPPNLVLGHEVTGEVVEIGRDVLFLKPGDLVCVPFPVACGRCMNCKHGQTSICMNTCADHPGAIYGYAGMGDWRGGQAEYFLLPFADFNALKVPNKEEGLKRILEIVMLADVLPTAYHGAMAANVQTGDSVYVAGAGPIGIACAASCFMRGASAVVIGDPNAERLANARKLGCLTIDTSRTTTSDLNTAIKQLIGTPEVDRAIDCVGYECVKDGDKTRSQQLQEQVLRDLMTVIRYGGGIGIPGAYFPPQMLSAKQPNTNGHLQLAFGELWNKAVTVGQMGQCPVHVYNEALLRMILHGRVKLSEALNVKVVGLDEAPKAYASFTAGEPTKYVFDPHGIVSKAAAGNNAE